MISFNRILSRGKIILKEDSFEFIKQSVLKIKIYGYFARRPTVFKSSCSVYINETTFQYRLSTGELTRILRYFIRRFAF